MHFLMCYVLSILLVIFVIEYSFGISTPFLCIILKWQENIHVLSVPTMAI